MAEPYISARARAKRTSSTCGRGGCQALGCPGPEQSSRQNAQDKQRAQLDSYGQSVLHTDYGQEQGNLNTGAQEPLQLRCTARDGQDLHQRRRTEGLGGDQRWHPGCRLLVARLRGTYRYAPLRKKGKRRHKKRRGYYGYPLLRTYTHGSGCAITGGAFYNPPLDANSPFPDEYVGDYFFADFCGG